MFYVSDIDGLKFKGPLEQLEKWRTVLRKSRSKPLKEKKSAFTFSSGPGVNAVAAYQKIISNNNMVEPIVHVHQIMSSPPTTIPPDTQLADVWLMLRKLAIRQVIVTTESREIIGVLADRDILKRINVIENKVIVQQELLADDVVNKEYVSTDAISDIRRVAKVLAQFQIDAMAVLEEEKLVGIVTRGDILRGFATNPKLNLWA